MAGAPRKYFTDRERTAAIRKQKNRYANETYYYCETCAKTVNMGNKPRHLGSNRHNSLALE